MKTVFLIATGSGVGGVLRYGVQSMVTRWLPYPFPFGTLCVNITGCLAIGVFFALAEKGLTGTELKFFLITGLCGGFTTFSAFSLENISLLRSGNLLYFFLYAAGSVAMGLLAILAGICLIKIIYMKH